MEYLVIIIIIIIIIIVIIIIIIDTLFNISRSKNFYNKKYLNSSSYTPQW